jgi:DNA-binding LacI/PurR family transcriptional regulator
MAGRHGPREYRAAEALGYSPNRLASRLASRSTQTLGLLLDLHNPVFADMYDGVARRVADSRHQLMVAVGSTDVDDGRAAIKSLVDLRVDGIILAGSIGDPEQLLPVLHGTPAVVLSRDIDIPGIDYVHTDDLAGAAALLERPGPPPTAIFAYNDLSAVGAIEELVRRGLRVPQDVSVVGYDNSDLASSPLLGMTSVDPNSAGLGMADAGLLLARLGGENVGEMPQGFTPTLVARTTSAAPPPSTGVAAASRGPHPLH